MLQEAGTHRGVVPGAVGAMRAIPEDSVGGFGTHTDSPGDLLKLLTR